jgi:hypothetical protein
MEMATDGYNKDYVTIQERVMPMAVPLDEARVDERLQVSGKGFTPEQLATARQIVADYIEANSDLGMEELGRRYHFHILDINDTYRDTRIEFSVEPKLPGEIKSRAIFPGSARMKSFHWYKSPDNAIEKIPKNPNYVYRGMSMPEWLDIKRTGEVQSKGSYNFDSQMNRTYFGDDPDTARSYASSFAPIQFQPTRDVPAMIIAVPKDMTTQDTVTSSEYYIEGLLSAEHIKKAWMLVVTEFEPGKLEIVYDKATKRVASGSRFSPYSRYTFVPTSLRESTTESLQEYIEERRKPPKAIYYHGTSTKNLSRILSQGLIPNPKQRAWAEDPQAGFHRVSKASLGGTYLTKNLTTARTSMEPGGGGRHGVIVVAEIQPRSLIADEDDVTGWLSTTIGGSNEYFVHQVYVMMATEPDDKWVIDLKAKYTEDVIRAFEYKLDQAGAPPLNDQELGRLRMILDDAAVATTMRKAAYIDPRQWRDYSWRYFDNEADFIPQPSKAEGEKTFRQVVDQVTRTLPRVFLSTDYGMMTARTMEPVNFRGANKIIAVVEIVPSPTREDRTAVKVHYGKLPRDFIKQWETGVGDLELVESISEQSCPLAGSSYGGLPGSGGIQAYTEYHIGAMRMAEAAHCILGSIASSSSLIKDEGRDLSYIWRGDRAHIEEEMSIIEDEREEYSNDLYTAMIDPARSRKEPEYLREAMEHLKEKSLKLKQKAEAAKAKYLKEEGWALDITAFEAARLTYDFVIALADEVHDAVKDWPERFYNPYIGLERRVRYLRRAINRIVVREDVIGESITEGRQDAKFRKEARKAWDKMLVTLRRMSPAAKKDMVFNDPKRGPVAMFVMPDTDLQIWMTQKRAAAYEPKTNRMFLPAMPKMDSLEATTEAFADVDKVLGDREARFIKNAFIHEYVHYMDVKRWKGDPEDIPETKPPRIEVGGFRNPQEAEVYFNNPLEMNAYFQMMASEIYDVISEAREIHGPYIERWDWGDDDMTYLVTGLFNFKEFFNMVTSVWVWKAMHMTDWYEFITPENKRKVHKRIAQLWEDVQSHMRREGITYEAPVSESIDEAWAIYNPKRQSYLSAIGTGGAEGWMGSPDTAVRYLTRDAAQERIDRAFQEYPDMRKARNMWKHVEVVRLDESIQEGRRDQEFRQEARKVYSEILAELRKARDNDRRVKSLIPDRVENAYRVPGYPELRLAFMPHAKSSGLGKIKGTDEPIIIIGITDRQVRSTSSEDELVDIILTSAAYYFETHKEAFLHEFIHYLDDVRSGGRAGGSARAADTGDLSAYFNSPGEYNAYYQSVMVHFFDTIDKVAERRPDDVGKAFNILYPTFNDFLDAAIKQFTKSTDQVRKDFWRLLTPDNKKRFKKRVAQTWEDLRQYARDKGADV